MSILTFILDFVGNIGFCSAYILRWRGQRCSQHVQLYSVLAFHVEQTKETEHMNENHSNKCVIIKYTFWMFTSLFLSLSQRESLLLTQSPLKCSWRFNFFPLLACDLTTHIQSGLVNITDFSSFRYKFIACHKQIYPLRTTHILQ